MILYIYNKMPKNRCDNYEICNNYAIKLHTHIQKYICKDCLKLDKYTLIYKTYVNEKYFINTDDHDLDEYYKRVFGNNGTMYILSDILKIFCDKHGLDINDKESINNKKSELFEQKRQQIENKKNNLVGKISGRTLRRERLEKGLYKYGLTLRNDSKLCAGYINGTIKDWTVKKIVHRMCEMKYLYEYCKIDNFMDEAKRLQVINKN